MLLRLKDQSGATIIVNTENMLFIGQAADNQTKRPILGQSVACMLGGMMLTLLGTPEDIARKIDGEGVLH